MFEEADLIFSYSRADAIHDGVLIDVSSRAKTLGYRIPVALTAGLHDILTAGASDETEISARVDLLLIALRDSIAGSPGTGDRLDFVIKAPSLAPLSAPIIEQFDGPDGLRDQFIILLAESARPAIGTRALTEALLKQCLILLLRRMIQRGTAPLPWMMAVTDDRLARALRAILERFAEPFTVETLADIAGMSRSSFAARFTDAFGQTPMSLLRAARLRRARELLVTTDTPMAQIAHDVGFVGRSNFSRAFRKMYSVDPTRFRTIAFGPRSE